MSLNVNDKGGDFEIVPEGIYTARCFKIIDLGTQTSTGIYGTKSQPKVMITWELLDSDIHMTDGKPYAITQFYTASLDEKSNLRKDLEAWRGKKFTDGELKGFDLNNVMNAYCMVQVIHSDDGKYANVNSIMAFKGTKPAAINSNVSFDIDEPDMEIFESFSDNMKTKIMQAPEWQNRQSESTEPVKEQPDTIIEDMGDEPVNLDDIPF